MRPIERKVLRKIKENGISFDGIWEIVDRTNPTELKKSYPDDSHFQSSKYFAKDILNNLLKYRLIKKDGNLFKRIDLENKKKKEEKK